MANYQDHCIILRSRAYREADSLLSVFGLKAGKVSAIAKGVRRAKSPLAGRVTPLSYSQLGLYQGRSTLQTITEAELVDGFSHIGDDLTRISWGMAMADVVDQLWAEHEASPQTFSLLVGALQALHEGRSPTSVGLATGWQLLRVAGYLPDMSHCGQCERLIETGPVEVAVDPPKIYCHTCRSPKLLPDRIVVSFGSLRSLQYWLALPPNRLGNGEAKGLIKDECLALFVQFVRAQVGRMPKSFEFLSTVESLPGFPRK